LTTAHLTKIGFFWSIKCRELHEGTDIMLFPLLWV